MASWPESRKRKRDGRTAGGADGQDDPLIVSSTAEKSRKVVIEPARKSADALKDDDLKVARSNPGLAVRRYQLEMLQVAIENNMVVFLETGCGKTLISILLMKQVAHKLREQGGKCIIVFLAPTIQLVIQQFEVIKINTDLKVACYYGAKGIDGWNVEIWKKEFNANEVLVMTPQILLDGLRLGLVTLEMVDLLIFDECHHAWGRHPYAKIMNEHYYTIHERPKIFGMTASPVIRKGFTSKYDCEGQIAQLEEILDSKIYTLKDRIELDLFVPTPIEITKYYCSASYDHDALKLKLTTLMDKVFQKHLTFSQFKDDKAFMEKTKKRIQKVHGNIEYCLEELGLICAYKAAQIYLGRHQRYVDWEIGTSFGNVQDSVYLFLKSSLEILEAALPIDVGELFSTTEGVLVAVKKGILTPKVRLLVELILHYRSGEDMRVIIFVERVIVAAVVSNLFQQLDCLSFVNSDYLASATSPLGRRKQQATVGRLLSGKVNVLVCTDVVEEGIDVQSCSCVIRFDLPKTMRSFIQSRGRARQSKSYFILLLERGNEKQQKLMYDIIQSVESMKELGMTRSHKTYSRQHSTVEPATVVYRVMSTGATVNCDSSISLINKYCAKLPGDKYYSPRPEFMPRKVEGEDNLYECILKLPPNAPVQEVISPPSCNPLCAKQLACLEACKKLHAIGALDDYLQPVTEIVPEEEMMNNGGKKSAGAGTTKRKELHSTCKLDALFGSWSEELTGVTLQVYKLIFSPQCNEERTYANFAFLIEAVLDDDVANTEIELVLSAGRVVYSKFSRSGEIRLDSNQLMDAKAFQEILCNGIFGKLMCRLKKSNGSENMIQNILKSTEMKNRWPATNLYLILPLKSDETEINQREVNIDWTCIHCCASGARLFKLLSSSQDQNSVMDIVEEILVDRASLLQCRAGDRQVIRLVNGPQLATDLIDKAVVTVHTGKIYCITEVLVDKTAKSQFPISKDSKLDNCMTYGNFFEKKYRRTLKHVNQPLLRVKQSHRPHNLLTRHVINSKDRGCSLKVDEANYVELPAELCLTLGVSGSVIRSLYLIPSVIHRLTSLMLASQLRKIIKTEHPSCPIIPASLIMEAMTTLRCLESFSFERLELLGDSFLKYAVSRHLFLKYEKKHEGQLSARRSWCISNATLHRVAMTCNLPGYIRDEPFDPRCWVAPGMLRRKTIACHCNPNNLEDSVKCSSWREVGIVKIGKSCDKGHRWMCSKTISDAVEALIGAYLVGGGPVAALELMKWMDMDVEVEYDLVEAAFQRAIVYPCVLRSTILLGLESLLGYTFQNKGLLVEAITHASQQDPEGGCCYQRLEFLGDSVLDLLITRHLFSMHPDLTPGILTDLRSAAVNNENFACVAVKQNIQKYLRHGSGALLTQITEFVKAVSEMKDGECRFSSFGGGLGGPKVLGDLVESLAGALLVDTRFDLERVWEIMKPILSPIVTPETLCLHPLRELLELCCQNGYCLSWKITKQGNLTVASAEVQLEDSTVVVGTGSKMNKKTAKMVAAEELLSLMEERGFYHPRRQYLQNSTTMSKKGTMDAILVSLKDEQQDCTSRNDNYEKDDNMYDGHLLVADDDVEQMTASSANLERCNTVKIYEHLSKDDCYVTKTDQNVSEIDQEANSLCGWEMTLEAISPKRKASRSRIEKECSLNLEPARKKSRHLESCTNFTVSKDQFMDFKDDTLTPEVKDLSTQCWSLEGGLTSSSKVEEGSNHFQAKHNEIFDNMSISTNKVDVRSRMAPVVISRSMLKGVPRNCLHELCNKKKWPDPVFELIEEGGLPHTRSFVFNVHIPQSELTKVQGDPKSDKKSAKDSAALAMFLELEKQGLCLVDEIPSLGLCLVK